MQVELDSCAIRFISVASVMAPHLSAFNLGGTISKAREQAELQARSNLPYTSCTNPLASSTDRRRAMSTLSAWAFGSVARALPRRPTRAAPSTASVSPSRKSA